MTDGPRTITTWLRTVRLVYSIAPGLVLALAITSVIVGIISGANVAVLSVLVGSAATAMEGGAWLPVLLSAIAIAGLQLVSRGISALNEYFSSLLTDRVTNSFTIRIAKKSSKLELLDFENPDVYDQLQVASREAGYRPFQIISGSLSTLQNFVALVSVFLVVAQWSILVAVIILFAPAVDIIVTTVVNGRMWRVEIERTNKRRMGQYLVGLLNTDRSFKEIKSLGISRVLIGRYQSFLDEFYQVDRKIQGGLLRGSLLAGLVESVLFFVAIFLAIQNSLENGDVGRLSGYVAGLAAVGTAVTALLTGLGTLHQNTLFLHNVFRFLDSTPSPLQSGPSRVSSGEPLSIEVKDLTFTYPGRDEPALKNINLSIPAGSTVAIVGENGAGKTTLVKLLARLYEAPEGTIDFNGRPISDYDLEDLRSSIAVLFQDFNRYELSVRDTVGFGNVAAHGDDERIWNALTQVGLARAAEKYPGRLDQQLGRFFDGGIQPSGGQWQRYGIARTIFRDAQLQILDEPTAALDPEGEEAIFRLLDAGRSATTRILISHRFSTVRNADLICVIDSGEIVERGSHSELMALGARYAELFNMQARGYNA